MRKKLTSQTDVNQSRRRIIVSGATLASAGLLLGNRAQAKVFPSRPLHMILPLPPGGAADRVCRLFAEELSRKWGQPVVVESRPGGGMVVGTLALARSEADGYTLGMISSTLSVNHVLRDDLPYNALEQLEPVAQIGYYTMAIIATNDFPANNVDEFIQVARKEKGALSCGSNGVGTSTEVALNLFSRMAEIDLRHVPYNGGTKLYSDMLGGHINVGFSIMGSADGFLQAGQLKLLGVTSANRSSIYPNVQSIAEVLPGYEVVSWTGFATPSGVSPTVLNILTSDMLEVAKSTKVSKALADMGVELAPTGGDQLKKSIKSEVDTIKKIMARQDA